MKDTNRFFSVWSEKKHFASSDIARDGGQSIVCAVLRYIEGPKKVEMRAPVLLRVL